MDEESELLMTSGVTATCSDCGDERIFVPIIDADTASAEEFCCTSCDAAVFLLLTPPPATRSSARHVA